MIETGPERIAARWASSGEARSGEAEFRRLLGTLPVGAYTCDTTGRITYYNAAAAELWGREPTSDDRWSGATRLYSTDGSPLAHSEGWMALAVRDERAYSGYEVVVERTDGSRRTVLAHATPILGDAGRVHGAVNVLVDISDRKRAEQIQGQLAAIVASSDDAIVSKTLDGRIAFWNDGAERLYGYSADEALGRPIDLIIPADRVGEEKTILERLLRGERVEHYETVRLAKDGTRIDVSLTSSPVRDGSGRVVGISKVGRDIGDRRRAAVVQSQLAAIVESSDDAIVSKTLDGRVLSWNAGAERLYGYTAAEAVGNSIAMIIPEGRHDEEQAILERLLRGERVEHYETVRLAKDGTPIDVSLTSSPVHDSHGRVVGVSKVARDIGAKKRTEAALALVRDELAAQVDDLRRLHGLSVRLSTTLGLEPILDETLRTAAAIENAMAGLLALRDESGALVVAATFGLDGTPCAALLEDGLADSPVHACFETGRRVVVEDLARDGEGAFARRATACGVGALHCTPLIKRDGSAAGVLALCFGQPHRPAERDIHLIDLCSRQALGFIDSAQLYQQVMDADRAKNAFLATLAHELRNPLAPVRNAVGILRAKAGQERELTWAIDVVDRQTKQMKRLIDDLLDIARITGDKLKLCPEWIDLRGVVDTAVEASMPLVDAKRHTLVVDGPLEPVTMYADPMRLAQALSNLLGNAAKYTEPGGRIELVARRADDVVEIAVRDSGVGIPREMLRRVFEMFAQVDQTLDRSEGGLGIGLALVQRLVGMHGGTVVAHSEGPGRGSLFTVRVPVAMTEATSAAAGAEAAADQARDPEASEPR